MKSIKYLLMTEVNRGTAEEPKTEEIFCLVTLGYSEANEKLAKREAYKGEYTVEDDGQPDPAETPTQLDRVEAQVTYTAMMTDTLLEV